MEIKNKFQKLMLISTVALMTVPSYAISPVGAAAATAGAIVGAYVVGKVVSTQHQHKEEERNQCDSCSAKKKRRIEKEERTEESRKAMKKDLKQYKKDLRKNKSELAKVERQDKKDAKKNDRPVKPSRQALSLKSKNEQLKAMVDNLEKRIKDLA